MRKILFALVLFALLSAAAAGIPEFHCEKAVYDNIISFSCAASEDANSIINAVLNDFNSVSDARLLNRELSSMDQDFIRRFNAKINEPGMKKQVREYLIIVKQGD